MAAAKSADIGYDIETRRSRRELIAEMRGNCYPSGAIVKYGVFTKFCRKCGVTPQNAGGLTPMHFGNVKQISSFSLFIFLAFDGKY